MSCIRFLQGECCLSTSPSLLCLSVIDVEIKPHPAWPKICNAKIYWTYPHRILKTNRSPVCSLSGSTWWTHWWIKCSITVFFVVVFFSGRLLRRIFRFKDDFPPRLRNWILCLMVCLLQGSEWLVFIPSGCNRLSQWPQQRTKKRKEGEGRENKPRLRNEPEGLETNDSVASRVFSLLA